MTKYSIFILFIFSISSAAIRDFFSDTLTQKDTCMNSIIHKVGFYDHVADDATQPRNFKPTYHHAANITGSDTGALFYSSINIQDIAMRGRGQVSRNTDGSYIQIDDDIYGSINRLYYQKISGPNKGKIYKLFTYETWGVYALPDVNKFVCLGRPNTGATTVYCVYIVDLNYVDTPTDSRFVDSFQVTTAPGDTIGTRNWWLNGINGARCLDPISSFNGVKWGLELSLNDTAGSIPRGTSFSGYIDIGFNSANKLNKAELHTFIRPNKINCSATKNYGKMLSAPNRMTNYFVKFKASDGTYIRARDLGGSTTFRSFDSWPYWECFSIMDSTASFDTLKSGDQIYLVTYKTTFYLNNVDSAGLGSVLKANGTEPNLQRCKFVIEKVGASVGDLINKDDHIILKSAFNNRYIRIDPTNNENIYIDVSRSAASEFTFEFQRNTDLSESNAENGQWIDHTQVDPNSNWILFHDIHQSTIGNRAYGLHKYNIGSNYVTDLNSNVFYNRELCNNTWNSENITHFSFSADGQWLYASRSFESSTRRPGLVRINTVTQEPELLYDFLADTTYHGDYRGNFWAHQDQTRDGKLIVYDFDYKIDPADQCDWSIRLFNNDTKVTKLLDTFSMKAVQQAHIGGTTPAHPYNAHPSFSQTGKSIGYQYATKIPNRLSNVSAVGLILTPTAPTNLAADTVSQNQVTLTWTDNSFNETGFYIDRSWSSNNFSRIATVGAGITTYTISNLASNTEYHFRIRAYNSFGGSLVSDTIVITTSKLISTGKTATASTSESGNPATNCNDGNDLTRWAASSGSMPQWWKVDLGALKTLTNIEIKFEVGSVSDDCYNFTIETSQDNVYWKTIVYQNSETNKDQIQKYNLPATPAPIQARYVRITIYDGPWTYWASMYEFKVYGR